MSAGGKGRQSYRSRWEQAFRNNAIETGVTTSAMLTGFIMASYGNADGTSITVSQEVLAVKQGVTSRTIRNNQTNLEGCNWYVLEHRGTGPGDSNRYRLSIATEETPEASFRSSRRDHRKSVTRTPEICYQNTGSQFPTTMHKHGDQGAAPAGAAVKTLIRPSDIPFDEDALYAEGEWETPHGVSSYGSPIGRPPDRFPNRLREPRNSEALRAR